MEVKTHIELEVIVVYDPPEADSHDCPGSDLRVDSILLGDEEISGLITKEQLQSALDAAISDYEYQGEKAQAMAEDAAEARAEAAREDRA